MEGSRERERAPEAEANQSDAPTKEPEPVVNPLTTSGEDEDDASITSVRPPTPAPSALQLEVAGPSGGREGSGGGGGGGGGHSPRSTLEPLLEDDHDPLDLDQNQDATDVDARAPGQEDRDGTLQLQAPLLPHSSVPDIPCALDDALDVPQVNVQDGASAGPSAGPSGSQPSSDADADAFQELPLPVPSSSTTRSRSALRPPRTIVSQELIESCTSGRSVPRGARLGKLGAFSYTYLDDKEENESMISFDYVDQSKEKMPPRAVFSVPVNTMISGISQDLPHVRSSSTRRSAIIPVPLSEESPSVQSHKAVHDVPEPQGQEETDTYTYTSAHPDRDPVRDRDGSPCYPYPYPLPEPGWGHYQKQQSPLARGHSLASHSYSSRMTPVSSFDHPGVPGVGVPGSESPTSRKLAEAEWHRWWVERLHQLEDRHVSKRLGKEAAMMRQCLSGPAYTLGARLLGIKDPVSMAPTSPPPSPSPPASLSATTTTTTTTAADQLLSQPQGQALAGLTGSLASLHELKALRSMSATASRKVSFSDLDADVSLTAQPPSSVNSKARRRGGRFGSGRRGVPVPGEIEEPSAYVRFLRRSDRLGPGFRPPWRPQPDAVQGETKADQSVEELCEWMRQMEAPSEGLDPGLLSEGPGGGRQASLAGLSGGGGRTDTRDSIPDAPLAGPGGRVNITCEDIRRLFDINLELPVARCLAVHVKEMCAVPHGVAEDARVPQRSRMSRVLRAVRGDVAAEGRPQRVHAFGRSLPCDDPARWRPGRPGTLTRLRWRPSTVPEELESMREAFGGLEHLRVTSDFVDFLVEKNVPLPPALRPIRALRSSLRRSRRGAKVHPFTPSPPHPAATPSASTRTLPAVQRQTSPQTRPEP